jgi:hypothetical protein
VCKCLHELPGVTAPVAKKGKSLMYVAFRRRKQSALSETTEYSVPYGRCNAAALRCFPFASLLAITISTVLLSLSAKSAEAQLTFYANRPAFNAASLTQVTEDFSEAVLPPAGAAAMSNPLDSTTNNTIFIPGDIVVGLRIATPDVSGSSALAVFGPGFGGIAPSTAVYGNFGGTSLNMTFYAGGATSVGFDLLTYSVNGSRTVTFFDAGDNLLGSITVSGLTTGTFVGVTSPTPIARVNTGKEVGRNTGVDNVSFGERSYPDYIPEAGSLALLLPTLLSLAVFRRR